jgi:uncharacterized C2H2 Zn-finger protein
VHDLVKTGGYRVILVHNKQAREELKKNASQAFEFEKLCGSALNPLKASKSQESINSSKEERYECKQCPRIFTLKDAFRKHQEASGHSNFENGEKVSKSGSSSSLNIPNSILNFRNRQNSYVPKIVKSVSSESFHQRAKSGDVNSSSSVSLDRDSRKLSSQDITKRSASRLSQVVTAEKGLKKSGSLPEMPGSFSCKECGKIFQKQHALSRHQDSTGHKKEEDSLDKHIAHTNMWYCEACGNEFENEKTLDVHQEQTSHCMQLYKCNQCDQAFTVERVLLAHVEAAHKFATIKVVSDW